MDNRLAALGVTGLALILVAISMFAPWWTARISGSGFGTSADNSESAKPFDAGGRGDDTLIDGDEALLAGVLVIVAILAILSAGVLAFMGFAGRPVPAIAPWLVLAAAVVLILAPILAITTWPGDNMEFWDRQSSGGFTASTGAGLGWYLSLVAAAACVVAALMGFMRRPQSTPGIQYAQRLQ